MYVCTAPTISFPRFGVGFVFFIAFKSGSSHFQEDRLPELRPAAAHDLILAD